MSASEIPSAPTVRALIRSGRPEPVAAARAAVAAQQVPCSETWVVSSWREGQEPAVDWLWLLDSGVIPEPDALSELLRSARGQAQAGLIAGVVVDGAGELDQRSLTIPGTQDYAQILDAVSRGDLALSSARGGSLLVSREAVALAGLPHPGSELGWSTALARRLPAVLATRSRAVRRWPPSRGTVRARAANLVRVLVAVEPRDRIWFLAHGLERAVSSPRDRGSRRALRG